MGVPSALVCTAVLSSRTEAKRSSKTCVCCKVVPRASVKVSSETKPGINDRLKRGDGLNLEERWEDGG